MPYVSPSGWIEPILTNAGVDRRQRRFHTLKNCSAIVRPDELIATDRTDDATRCTTCGK
jgi:hypothetical protein